MVSSLGCYFDPDGTGWSSWKDRGARRRSEVRRETGTPPRVFFVRVANAGLMLDAASRIAAKGDRGAVAGVEQRVPNGLAGEGARVDFNAEFREAAEKVGIPHPGCFVQRVRKNMKGKELRLCAVQKSRS